MKRKQPSLFFSVLRGYLWVIILLAVIAPLLMFADLRSSFRSRAVDDLARSAEALVPVTRVYLETGDFAEMDSVLTAVSSRMDTRITVIARDGTVLADSEKHPGEMENHRTRREVIAAFNGVTGQSSRYSATLGTGMIYAAVPVFMGDSIPAVLRTSFFFESHSATVSPVIGKMILVLAAVLVVTLLSAWVISRRIALPIRDLADVAGRVAKGELQARAAPGFTREQNQLAATMNQTLGRTEKLIGELTRSDSRNLAILHSMTEGVIVVDSDSEIILMNQSFRSIFKMEDNSDTPPEVKEKVFRNNCLKTKGRFEYQGKMIEWSCARAADSGDTVFSFRDITREFRLSEIKRAFAINVSHELRTPLTAIKGYAETLKEDSSGESSHYLDVILRNTERLIALVKDIQILSEVERGKGSMTIEPVPVEDIMNTVLPLFKAAAEKRGLRLEHVQDKSGIVLMADRYRVEQVLVNLIDNALKYTDQGGVEVRVSTRGKNAVFAVSDTGRGIPAEHQERIFQRFFVVDRSRSRKMGGTGLGLAISKHIVEAHGGTISVTSTPGQGSIFLFTLPMGN